MNVRNALSFHPILPAHGHVQQKVDEMVLQQIDFVHVEDAAMSSGQQAGLERLDAFLQGSLQVERAHQAVFAGPQGKLDQRESAAVAEGR